MVIVSTVWWIAHRAADRYRKVAIVGPVVSTDPQDTTKANPPKDGDAKLRAYVQARGVRRAA